MNSQIIEGSVFSMLPTLAEKSFHCCVTSPPYWNLRDYDAEGQLGSEDLHDCLGWATGSKCGACFVCHMEQVFAEVHRVLRDDGVLFLNLGDNYAHSNPSGPQGKSGDRADRTFTAAGAGGKLCGKLKPKDLCGVPWRVALALQASGWYLRSDIVWHKPNPMPSSTRDRCTSAHEYIFMLTKSERYYFDQFAVREKFSDDRNGCDGSTQQSIRNRGGRDDGFTKPNGIDPSAKGGRNLRDVWTIPTVGFPGEHFAVFPYELAETCLKAGAPFVVCAECGRPHQRVVERGNSEHHCRPGCGCGADQNGGKQNWNDGWQGYGGYANTALASDDFRPACDCGATIVTGRVLDPFSGAGTTGVVCRDLGLDYTGIELNPKSAQMSRDRIADPFYETKLRSSQRVERENKEQMALFDE